jgi:hypothetical protein
MQTLEPSAKADLNVTQYVDAGGADMSSVRYELLKNEAVLKRLVANAEVRVTEIYNRQVVEELFVPGLQYGYKMRLEGHEPPCRVTFEFPEKAATTGVQVFVSYDYKEPAADKCSESYVMSTERFPKISLKGVINPKTQRPHFNKPYVYLTVIAGDQANEMAIKVLGTFPLENKRQQQLQEKKAEAAEGATPATTKGKK